MRCLVIGASGYIGGRLIAAGRRMPSASWIAWSRHGIETADGPVAAGRDWLDPRLDLRCLECIGDVDAIVHLAFPDAHSVSDANEEPLTHAVEAGMERVLDVASLLKARILIHLSTVKVYGRGLAGTVREDTPAAPADAYSRLHRTAEEVLRRLSATRGVPSLSMRLSNAFGCPASRDVKRWDLIVNEMCKSAVTDHRIVLGCGRHSLRDFLPMSAAVSRIISLVRDGGGTDAGWRPANLCSGRSSTIAEMAELVATRARGVLKAPVSIIPPPGGPSPRAEEPLLSIESRLAPRMNDREYEQRAVEEIDSTLAACAAWFA